MPRTFHRANTCVSGASWKVFQHRYPEKTFEEFWEFCCRYHSLHNYPLCFFMTMNDTSKVALIELTTYEASVIKEEPREEDMDHCFVYDMAKSRGEWYLDGSCIELPFS
jgi:hypothetical protein